MREQTFRRAFGRAVKSARLAAGLTQREAAERMSLAEKYLSRIEVGMATPSLPVAARLARLLGVGLDALTSATLVAEQPEINAIAAMLRGRSKSDVVRARWIIEAFCRPLAAGDPRSKQARRPKKG
ncbi:MAG: helix-turn-helix transcriptional regulator [Deltaproteobacteria bacterium]